MKHHLRLAALLWACALPRNTGTEKRVCTVASSPDFGAAEIHRSLIEEGRHRMLRGQQIEIAPEQTTALAPGGLHLMLFRPSRQLAPGESTQITLDCGGTAVSAPFFVRARS
jgi:periplasmic copper chaperone A